LGHNPQQRRLPHARRPFEDHVPARAQSSYEHLGLTTQTDDLLLDPGEEIGSGGQGSP
jgi:hypothetical protein